MSQPVASVPNGSFAMRPVEGSRRVAIKCSAISAPDPAIQSWVKE